MARRTKWQQARLGVILGLVMIQVALVIFFFNLKWLENALAGPQPITAAEVLRLEQPSDLDNPWVTLKVARVHDTALVDYVRSNGEDTPRRILLLQIENRWLLTEVPVTHGGGQTFTGTVTVWKATPLRDRLKEIKAKLKLPDELLLPVQLDAATDFRVDYFQILGIVAFLGVGGIVVVAFAGGDLIRKSRVPSEREGEVDQQELAEEEKDNSSARKDLP